MIHHPLRPPKGANPAAIELWMQACAAEPYNPVLCYEQLCYSNGLEPYSGSKVGNADVQSFLRARRRAVVRFLNHTGLQSHTTPIRWPQRRVEFYPGGFRLTIQLQVRADPTFGRWVQDLRLPYKFGRLRDRNRRLVLTLDAATKFFVYNSMITEQHRWFIGYTIDCPLVPALKNAVPDEQYIIHQLWLPVARARRPVNPRPLQI